MTGAVRVASPSPYDSFIRNTRGLSRRAETFTISRKELPPGAAWSKPRGLRSR